MKLAVISTVFVVSLCDAVQKQDLGEDSEQVSINEGEMGVEHYAFLEFVESASNGLDNVILYDAGLKGFTHKITIGKPDQKFVVHVTTYSSMLWIPHVNCTISRNKFNPSKSNTFVKRNQSWTLSSGTSGLLGSDNVKIGGGDEVQIVVDNSVFGMATKISSGSLEVGFDGELGLGFVSEVRDLKPFVYQAIEKIPLAVPLFTVFMNPVQAKVGYPTGYITYGSVDKKNCGQVIGVRSFSSNSLYLYKIDGISMGNVKYNYSYEVEQDLGPFILGPEIVVKQFASVAGANYVSGFYEISCSARFPSLEIMIGSIRYSIPSDKLIIKVNDKCLFAMNTTPQGGLLWRFGAPFNRQYCVVFDIAKKQIGFTTVGTNSTTARPPITTRRANVTATRTVPASTRRTNVTVTRTVPTSTRRTTAKKASPSSFHVPFILILFMFFRQMPQ